VEAAGVELSSVLRTRKLLILGTATRAKKAPLPDPLYVYCTKMVPLWSPAGPHSATVSHRFAGLDREKNTQLPSIPQPPPCHFFGTPAPNLWVARHPSVIRGCVSIRADRFCYADLTVPIWPAAARKFRFCRQLRVYRTPPTEMPNANTPTDSGSHVSVTDRPERALWSTGFGASRSYHCSTSSRLQGSPCLLRSLVTPLVCWHRTANPRT
jgi:hypothetical protein